MSNPLVVVANTVAGDVYRGVGLWIWCPGCDKAHRPQAKGPDGSMPEGPCWDWNGATDTTFTISPSLLVWTGKRDAPEPGDRRCHSYVKNGQWQFLTDCTHPLAGRDGIPMVPVPDWLMRE